MRVAMAALLACALLASACGGRDADAPPAEPPADAAPGAFDELTGTLDRAGAVEGQVLESKQRTDRALDEAEGDPEARRP